MISNICCMNAGKRGGWKDKEKERALWEWLGVEASASGEGPCGGFHVQR